MLDLREPRVVGRAQGERSRVESGRLTVVSDERWRDARSDRFAYLIQSHRASGQIRRLIRTIRRLSPDAVIVVSHSADGVPLSDQELAAAGADAVLRPVVTRGDFSQVSAYLDAIEALLREGPPFAFVTNLSGQCYPVRPLKQVERETLQSGVDAFLEHFDALQPEGQNGLTEREGFERYFYEWRRIWPSANLFVRALSKPIKAVVNRGKVPFRLRTDYGVHVGAPAADPPFRDGYRCLTGSCWMTLSRSGVETLLRGRSMNAAVERHFRRTLCPDEGFIHTLLGAEEGIRIVPTNRHYVDWRGSRHGHPKTLGVADLGDIAGSGAAFARKFDAERDPMLLDIIDRTIG